MTKPDWERWIIEYDKELDIYTDVYHRKTYSRDQDPEELVIYRPDEEILNEIPRALSEQAWDLMFDAFWEDDPVLQAKAVYDNSMEEALKKEAFRAFVTGIYRRDPRIHYPVIAMFQIDETTREQVKDFAEISIVNTLARGLELSIDKRAYDQRPAIVSAKILECAFVLFGDLWFQLSTHFLSFAGAVSQTGIKEDFKPGSSILGKYPIISDKKKVAQRIIQHERDHIKQQRLRLAERQKRRRHKKTLPPPPPDQSDDNDTVATSNSKETRTQPSSKKTVPPADNYADDTTNDDQESDDEPIDLDDEVAAVNFAL